MNCSLVNLHQLAGYFSCPIPLTSQQAYLSILWRQKIGSKILLAGTLLFFTALRLTIYRAHHSSE